MKKILLPIILTLSIALVACNNTTIKHNNFDAKMPYYETLSELEESAEQIIRVKKTDVETPVIKRSEGHLISAWTFSDVEIIDVYKDISDSLKVGDTVSILENEAYDKETNTVEHVNGYIKMVPGYEYLLFLRASEYDNGDKYYVSLGLNLGTVSLQNDGREELINTISGESINNETATDKEVISEIRNKYIK